MRKLLCIPILLCMSSNAYADTAIVVSTSIPGIKIGSVVTATSAGENTYEISSNGEVAVTNKDGLAFKASGQDGCFEIGIEQAYELYKERVIFDAFEIRGRKAEDLERGQQQWAGASLELSASVSAGAGIEVCLKIEQPIVLSPTSTTLVGPQNMVATRFSSLNTHVTSPQSRLEVSAKIEAGGQLQAKLDAFCTDFYREAPNEKTTYRPAFNRMDALVEEVARSIDTIVGNTNRAECIWAARARTAPESYRRDAMAKIMLSHAKENAKRRVAGLDTEGLSINDTLMVINSSIRELADSCPKLVTPCGPDCQPDDKAYIEPMNASNARQMQTSLAQEIEKLETGIKGGNR